MLTELCQELRNWFDRDHDKWFGTIVISDGQINANGAEINLIDGQHFRIIGSLLNDGVYKYPADNLKDETFSGAVWSMAIPPSVVELADRIGQWIEDNKAVIDSPYQSESFGGYSYSKGSGGSGSGGSGNSADWRNHFADDLNRWRKL
jgi:hypothetical protein